MTKKKVKFGALSTENMPKKSHETPKPPSRPAREIVKDVPTSVEERKYYTGLKDVCKLKRKRSLWKALSKRQTVKIILPLTLRNALRKSRRKFFLN